MPTKTPPETLFSSAVPDDLLHELEHIVAVLRQQVLAEGKSEDTMAATMAIVRTFQGVTPEIWKKALPLLSGAGWLAFPLDKPAGQMVQALQKQLELLFYQRDHDPLTGLANRRLFDATLSREISRSTRTKTEVSIIMLDIDNFKMINDLHGHAMGDEVLRRLGALLQTSVRPYDLAARIGGEEFCLIMPGASSWKARTLANRILDEFREEEFAASGGERFNVTFSAGVATSLCHLDCLTPEELFSRADSAMYQAKHDGKNRVSASAPSMGLVDSPSLVQAEEKQFLYFGGNE